MNKNVTPTKKSADMDKPPKYGLMVAKNGQKVNFSTVIPAFSTVIPAKAGILF